MPRVSRPAAPASARKHGVSAVSRIGNSFSSRMDSRTRFVSDTSAVGMRPRRSLLVKRLNGIFIGGGQQFTFDGPELIVFKLRQLPGAEHHGVAHQQRRIDLGIAVLVGVQVEHELPDRALQPRQTLLQHHKARAAQFRRGFEIHVAERAAEIVMRLRRERIIAHRAEMMAHAHCRARRRHRELRPAAGSESPPIPWRVPRPPSSPPASSSGMVVLSSATSAISARRARRPWPSWRRRFPSTRHCAAPAPAPTSGSPRGASRRSPAATPTAAASPRRFSAASKAWALSRIHLMSCMAIFLRHGRAMPAKARLHPNARTQSRTSWSPGACHRTARGEPVADDDSGRGNVAAIQARPTPPDWLPAAAGSRGAVLRRRLPAAAPSSPPWHRDDRALVQRAAGGSRARPG